MTGSDDPVLVHDYLLVLRGAERTFAAMADCWPQAPVRTLLYDEEGTWRRFGRHKISVSPLQRLRPTQDGFRRLLPLYPLAAERLPVSGHDVVVSSSSAFAHGVRPDPGAVHVCYCHSPFRYAWHERETALRELPRPARPALKMVLDRVRRWDLAASRRVTHYVANSEITRQRIGDFYGRDSVVVHPPVAVDRFSPGEAEDWYLTVSEVVSHKRIEVALEAARRSGSKLKVVGTGPDLPRLQREYEGHAEFLGRIGDDELRGLYPRARALIMANVEEFGIAGVEAQAAGRPVLAADAGGARETVVEGVTGHRVRPDDVDALAEAMADADLDRLDPSAIVANAERFSVQRFQERLQSEVRRAATAA
jgi:glycosyltransferase involved in cell wall biosynthesis